MNRITIFHEDKHLNWMLEEKNHELKGILLELFICMDFPEQCIHSNIKQINLSIISNSFKDLSEIFINLDEKLESAILIHKSCQIYIRSVKLILLFYYAHFSKEKLNSLIDEEIKLLNNNLKYNFILKSLISMKQRLT
ncbi:hypothetical protein ES708_31926 [subsurface metagenome]